MFGRFEIGPEPCEVSFTRLRQADIETPEFSLLLELWNAKRGDRRAPARGDFDPIEMGPLLPRLVLIDVLRAPPDFRYRLAGTETHAIHGIELTGRSVLDIVPVQQGQLLWNDLCEMLETWEPQHVRLRFINSRGFERAYSVLRVPLSKDGSAVDMIMAIQNFGAHAAQLREYYEAVRRAAR